MSKKSDIIYSPRNGDEVHEACFSKPPIYLYSRLAKAVKQVGAEEVMRMLMAACKDSLILVQDPEKMNTGHWTSLSFDQKNKKAYFFSSYGGKPDVEKNEWIPNHDLEKSDQVINVINDGLKRLAEKGWEIHYNQYPYQRVGDKTATCGIWCVAFMNSGLNPDEFHQLVEYGGYTPQFFYNLYFE